MLLATPVLAMTVFLVAMERLMGVGIFEPARGGDPLLFQHMLWFYSHPAVYIMILPAMGVVTELVTCYARKSVFGYSGMAYALMAIAVIESIPIFIAFIIFREQLMKGIQISGLKG